MKKNKRTAPLALVALGLALTACGAWANGLGENISWQFQTTQDRVNKSAILDQIEKKKGGYYDAIKSTYNSTTYIDRQYNCSVSAGSTGNTGSNGQQATTSSPGVSNSSATNSSTSANAASNGLAQTGLSGVLGTDSGSSAAGGVSNGQSNSGNLSSGVDSSNTSGATGPVSANGGTSDLALNSAQTNAGNLTASVTGSTACMGPLN